MAWDQSGGADESARERAAAARAGRKRLGANGRPQTTPTTAERDAANRTAVTVTGRLDPNPQAVRKGVDEA